MKIDKKETIRSYKRKTELLAVLRVTHGEHCNVRDNKCFHRRCFSVHQLEKCLNDSAHQIVYLS